MFAAGAGVGALLVLAALFAAGQHHREVVYRSDEPRAQDDGPRHLLVVLREDPLVGQASYRLYAGRDPSFGYGHFLDLDAGTVERAIAEKGTAIEHAEWTARGVLLRLGTGHELFIPARQYRGGR
ncbi:hypothetical protein GCM10009560_72560 [Nonomuraea longicatena]|uniref:Uncharacterized protein n=1 Tax=Nonomuraea longicatena TaxID=83682 RepID=A0ABP4BLN6_9ACTN